MRKMVDSVRKARIQPGEESGLRATVRAMEARRATAEQCHTARQLVTGDGSMGLEGGLVGAMRMLELQLKGVLTREANAASAAEISNSKGGSNKGSRRQPAMGLQHKTSDVRSSGLARSNGSKVDASSDAEEDGEVDAVAEEVREQQQREERAKEAQATEAAAKDMGQRDHSMGASTRAGVDGEEEEEEEEHPIEEASLMLSEMRQQMSVVDDLVRSYARSVGFSLHEFESASERLRTIERLLRTHRCRSSAELLEAAQRAEAKMDAYEEMLANAEAWEAEMDELRARLVRCCCALSAARRAAVPGLVHLVQSALGELAMGDARFDVQVTWTVEPQASQARESEALDISAAAAAQAGEPRGGGTYKITERGLDSVVLRLAAGPSEPLRPLAAVASGGEAARIMLALKAASSGGVEVGAGAGAGTPHDWSGADFSDTQMNLSDDAAEGSTRADIKGKGWNQGSDFAGQRTLPAGGGDHLQGQRQQNGVSMSAMWMHTSMSANGSSVTSIGHGVPATDLHQANRATQSSEGTNGSVHKSHQEGSNIPQPHLPPGNSDATPHLVLHPPPPEPHTSPSLPREDVQLPPQFNENLGHSSSYADQQPIPAAGHSRQQQHPDFAQQQQQQQQQQPSQPQQPTSAKKRQRQQQQQQPALAQQHPAFKQQQEQQQQQLQQQPHVPILVLDELDSGVGSRLGSSVGAMLRRMAAASSQVVCVTHLPQVACFAEHHVKVLKHFQPPPGGSQQESTNSSSSSRRRKRGRVTTRFAVLSTYEQRVQEVAEMMGMNEDVARNLLQQAWGIRRQQ
ncbi:hypothetical protein DUNSADRAFT_15676 [Dunaliella salina]|nr:hypothetical protein DUNSADRAFT_15676 [Dunaliella salina]|eukprot:KAF5829677.1 hypothetical protein DUNSADRAFT_15676 [Dunaliella salina]